MEASLQDTRAGAEALEPLVKGKEVQTLETTFTSPGSVTKSIPVTLRLPLQRLVELKKASVMYDPHTRESRGFGFVTMESSEEADAAIAAMNAVEFMGKVMNVEKARRGRARTPTPGRYYGPPKRGDFERPYDPRPYDSRYSRDYDDRRGGGGRGGRYDDYRGGGGRDHDRHRDYDRGDRDRERGGYGRERYDDRRH